MIEINQPTPDREVSIAIVASRFNEDVTTKLTESVVARLKQVGVTDESVLLIWVPGAVEIPLMASRCADSDMFDAIIAIGAVIRGETAHFDFVAKQVSDGCQAVALQNDIPVIFGVLTTENKAQALARAEEQNIGADWADAALQMIATGDLFDELQGISAEDDDDDDFDDDLDEIEEEIEEDDELEDSKDELAESH